MGHGPLSKPYFIRTGKLEKSVIYCVTVLVTDQQAGRSSVSLGWRCSDAAGRDGIVSDSHSKQSHEKGSDRPLGLRVQVPCRVPLPWIQIIHYSPTESLVRQVGKREENHCQLQTLLIRCKLLQNSGGFILSLFTRCQFCAHLKDGMYL